MNIFFRCEKAMKLLFFILPFTVVAETNNKATNLVQKVEIKPVITPGIMDKPTDLKPVVTPDIVDKPTDLEPVVTPGLVDKPTDLEPVVTPDIVDKPTDLEPVVTPGLVDKPTDLEPVVTPDLVDKPTDLKPVVTPGLVDKPTDLEPVVTPDLVDKPTDLKPVIPPTIGVKPTNFIPISSLPFLGIDEAALDPVFVPISGGEQIELKPTIVPILDVELTELDPGLNFLFDLGTGKIEYEPNNIFEHARPILPNLVPQVQKFDYKGDEDWLSFYAEKGSFYNIATAPASDGQTTNLAFELYNEDKGVVVNLVDSNVAGESESINWQAPTSGFYILRVINKKDSFDMEGSYQVAVTKFAVTHSATVAGKVMDSCTESGLMAAITGKGLEQISQETGEFSGTLTPDTSSDADFKITARAEGYNEKSKLIKVEELTATPVAFNLLPETGCSVSEPITPTETPTEDPVPNEGDMELLKQQAVANYDDSTRVLTVKDVRVGNDIITASLLAQENFSFILTTVENLTKGVSNRPAFYDFDSLLADIPEVFVSGKLYKVKLRRLNTEWTFVVEKADQY